MAQIQASPIFGEKMRLGVRGESKKTKRRISIKPDSTKIKAELGVPILFVLLVVFAAGCLSPEKKIAKRQADLGVQWQTNLQQQLNLPKREVDWPTALAFMLEHNLKLIQSRTELTNAHEGVKQVFKDLIPNLTARSGLSKELTKLDTITPDDVTFSADSFFNIPGVVSFAARLYAAKLYEYRTIAAYQLAEREQIVELYRLFFNAETVRDQNERLAIQRANANAMMQVDPISGRMMLTELETRELAAAREDQTLQDHASDVLGSRDFDWQFSTNGLPVFHYAESPLPLGDTNRVARLQMKLVAVELEAARAQLMGLKLRYWPELNIFISSPPIYSRFGGETVWWDADRLRGSADLFWTLDTRGNLGRSIRQTKRQQALQRERYRQEALSLMNKLIFTQGVIKSVNDQLTRVNQQISLLQAVPPAQSYFSIQKYAFDYRNLTQQQLQLKRDLSELNALFWFVDEDAWRSQPTALPPNFSGNS
jgi:hypothetical protein